MVGGRCSVNTFNRFRNGSLLAAFDRTREQLLLIHYLSVQLDPLGSKKERRKKEESKDLASCFFTFREVTHGESSEARS